MTSYARKEVGQVPMTPPPIGSRWTTGEPETVPFTVESIEGEEVLVRPDNRDCTFPMQLGDFNSIVHQLVVRLGDPDPPLVDHPKVQNLEDDPNYEEGVRP